LTASPVVSEFRLKELRDVAVPRGVTSAPRRHALSETLLRDTSETTACTYSAGPRDVSWPRRSVMDRIAERYGRADERGRRRWSRSREFGISPLPMNTTATFVDGSPWIERIWEQRDAEGLAETAGWIALDLGRARNREIPNVGSYSINVKSDRIRAYSVRNS